MVNSAHVDHRGRSRLAVALGEIVRELRVGRDWDQEQVAALLGLHVKTYATYEQGIRAMSLETFVEFCTIFRANASIVVDEVLRRERAAVRIAAILAAGSAEDGVETTGDDGGECEEYPVPLAKSPENENREGDV